MNLPKFTVSNQKEESISTQGVKLDTDPNNLFSVLGETAYC